MDPRGELRPGRDFVIALAISVLGVAAIFSAPVNAFPVLHTILNTGLAMGTVVVSLLFWDLGWRTRSVLLRYLAIVFAITGALQVSHVIAALEPSTASDALNQALRSLRSGTWAPPAYLLPLGTGVALLAAPAPRNSKLGFASGCIAAAVGLFVLFQWLPRYTAPTLLGIIRPSLAGVPLLWIPVALALWRRRAEDRIAHALAFYACGLALSHALMLYSDEATSKFAMSAHLGVFAFGLSLLLSLMQMGTADNVRRMRVEHELKVSNEALEARVGARTAELEWLNADLRREVGVRHEAEVRTLMQLQRLELLRRISRAIADRQDLESIFQVVVGALEEHMPADFAALCTHERDASTLTVSRVGARSVPVAQELDLLPGALIGIDKNGLSRSVGGQQVYEPDIGAVDFPFPQRLSRAGLRSLVMVPLVVEQRSGVFAVLLVARRTPQAFSSGECEFLRQLCDHVAIAANQAQLHASLQQAYEHLQRTQEAALEQERLRALGQMASGIAHDINNAISPVAIYVEGILEFETGFSERTRRQLEIIQRAIDDVARTVARMGEFSRRRPTQLDLEEIPLERVLREVLELTRARWSDMAQQRGVVIEAKVESAGGSTTGMGIESELREALVNLVLNAIDAMPEGGKLTLRTGTHGANGIHAGRVYIEVSDTGIGMDEETRRRCLEPFFTTKGERGTGLGLAMVYGIAQRHEMDLDIVSAPHAGSTFRLVFPPRVSRTAPAADDGGRVPERTRILLIDDDVMLLTSLRDILEREGHEVITAQGGQQGIERFLAEQRAGRPFPVVITDLGMPHVDGRAVAGAIARAAPGTPVLMLTGWGQRLADTGDVPRDVVAVIGKPPRLGELRQRLAECMDKTAG
ncbi:MAG TPA: ATP-binding protein [Steroidobacteraceae bacterium]|nr:ATP-binding protein [Steroidobacteraceae bacterium]